jgi:hypothetical protein
MAIRLTTDQLKESIDKKQQEEREAAQYCHKAERAEKQAAREAKQVAEEAERTTRHRQSRS